MSDDDARSLFVMDGDRFVPTQDALSPWGSDRLHGGPVLGLVTHAALQDADGASLQLARLTVDLFRAVPNAPLQARVDVLRAGRRLRLTQVSVWADEREVTRATALMLKPSEGTHRHLHDGHPDGPEGLETESLIGAHRAHKHPPGFHFAVETRRPERGDGHRAIWMRTPMPLIAGVDTDATVAAAILADFNNAVSSIAGYEDGRAVGHINTDTTLYLERPPVGQWSCLESDIQSERDGISISQVLHYDTHGRFGRSVQARLES